jgi:hypothetical protein
MATWQFDLYLIPQGEPIPLASEDGLEVPGIPGHSARYIQENLADFLGRPCFVMEDWIVYGAENGTRVDFLFDDTGSVEVMVRLDASALDNAFLDVLCALALQLDCIYFDVEGRQFIEPRRELLLRAIASSGAARFVKNPRGFIASRLPV